MELTEETFHLIHQYLSGQGSPEQRAEFEQRMQVEKELADEVATQRQIRNGLRANDYKKLFQDIHAELQSEGTLPVNHAGAEKEEPEVVPLRPESTSQRNSRWPYLAAAASILIAIGIVWYIGFAPKNTPVASDTPTPEAPALDTATHVQPAGVPDTAKINAPKPKQAKPEPASVNRTELLAMYFEPKVTLESPFSKEKLGISPSALAQWRTDTAHVHQGARYLAQHDAEKSLQEFQQVENSRFQQVKSAASWYTALVYLQQNDLENCKRQLEEIIADPNNAYAKQAKALLIKIQ